VTSVPVGLNPFGIAVNPEGTLVYVANATFTAQPTNGTVSIINVATNTVIKTVTVQRNPVAFGHFIVPPAPLPGGAP
jgi:YVTN family beta-propeller protein